MTLRWIACTAMLLARPQNAPDATVPGEIVLEDATFTCLGLEWRIEGDANENCRVEVEFRDAKGGAWRKALPLLRVERRTHPQYKVDYGNLLAGSLFNLEPDTEYEVKLALSDPDGGKAEKIVRTRTRAEPAAPREATLMNAPATAIAAAKPGDVIQLAPGTHTGPFRLAASGTAAKPIVLRGPAVVDGAGAKVALDVSDTKHVVLENLTLRNAREGLEARNSEHLVVRRCRVEQFGYVGIAAPGRTRFALIEDCTIVGPALWEAEGRAKSSYGLVLNGTGHVVRHNRISDCWDCISLASDDHSLVTGALDLHHNDISRATDDGIEGDYVRHNTRIFRNRLANVFKGLSCQPVFGGPTYLLQNEVYNARSSPFKFHVEPSGMIVLHNTTVCAGAGWSGGDWRNCLARNNLILGARGLALDTAGAKADLDYDGWMGAGGFARWNRERHATLEDFARVTGLENHGRKVTLEIFERAEVPPERKDVDGKGGYGRVFEPGSWDLRLRKGCAAIDAGETLPNINDGFRGTAPDLGCHELGDGVPVYGPRP